MNAKTSVQNAQPTQHSFAQKAITKRSRADEIDDPSDDTTDVEELPQIDELDVDIEIEGGFRAFDLASLGQAGQNAQPKRFKSRRVSGLDGLSPTKYGSRKNSQED